MAFTSTWRGFSAVRRWMISKLLDNADSHELLSVVAAVHHQGVHQTLNNGALSLPEPLSSEPSSGVGKIPGVLLLHSDVILQGHVRNLNIVTAPLSEKLNFWELWHHLLEVTTGGGGHIGLFTPIFRHFSSFKVL